MNACIYVCVCNCELVYASMHAHLTSLALPLLTADRLENNYLEFSKGAIINVLSKDRRYKLPTGLQILWRGELGGATGFFPAEYVKEVYEEFPMQKSQLVPWPRAMQIRRYAPRLH